MDRLIEQKVKECIPCQAAMPLTVKQPLQMSELPPEPWQVLAADLFGHLPMGEKNHHHKMPEIEMAQT